MNPGARPEAYTGRGCLSLFFAVWITGWSACTLAMDGIIVYTFVTQLRTLGFATADGTVTHSAVRQEWDAEGDRSYHADIKYTYAVGGRRFDSDRLRAMPFGSNDRWAHDFVAAHPVGGRLVVYYNRSDPSEAVLTPGIEGSDLFIALFLTPFNLVMVGAWIIARNGRRSVNPALPAAGARVVRRDPETRVRLSAVTPLVAAGGVALALSFLSIFVVGFTAGFHASLWLMGLVWALVLVPSVLTYLKLAARAATGRDELVIDTWQSTLRLPQATGQDEPVTLPFADIAAIDVERTEISEYDGGTHHKYAPTVRWRGAQKEPAKAALVQWTNESRAERFAAWLREQVGLATPPAPSSDLS